MTAFDTSVVIASFATWHDLHARARAALTSDTVVPAHALIETYATLTRMPAPYRLAAPDVARYLELQWTDRVLAPDIDLQLTLPGVAMAAGVSGGGVYDALVGLTAHRSGHVLLTVDRRAERTYRALGVEYRFL